MHISAVEEYGLRCALQLASLPGNAVLAASQIAEREGISVQYASKIMHLFRKAGLVSAARGMQGGFRLSQPAHHISLKSVFSAIREEERLGFCDNYKGLQAECVHMKDCSVRPVWHVLSSYFDSVLEKLSLADLARSETESRRRIELFARTEAERIRDRFRGEESEEAPVTASPAGTREAELESQFDNEGDEAPQVMGVPTEETEAPGFGHRIIGSEAAGLGY
jgi:Rrf2 family transcriptional regulator, iron-sulfur cluster assembly transcription factor